MDALHFHPVPSGIFNLDAFVFITITLYFSFLYFFVSMFARSDTITKKNTSTHIFLFFPMR